MTKTTLLMIASASMLLAAPAVDNTTTQIPQKGMYIMPIGQGTGMGMKNNCKGKMSKKCQTMHKGQGMNKKRMPKMMMMQKKKMNSPFLIKHGLPHLTKMIMPYMNDPAFNLTAEQKVQLAKVRATTMNAVMEAKPQVMALKKDIVNASSAGVSAEDLKDKVAKLALLQAAATMTHLKCIESTKAILTKDQLYFLLANKNKKMKHGKKGMMKRQQSRKCASGKCGRGQGMNK